jgi:HlyD family secretion protein
MIKRSMRVNFWRPAMAGILIVAVILGGGGLWAAMAEISSAIIASGTVGVFGKPKTIQHLDGGLVEKILVDAGQRVETGDELVTLDDETIIANIEIYRGRMRDLLVRKVRLLAELEDKGDFQSPSSEQVERFKLGSLETAIVQQRALLVARRQSRLGEIEQLGKRVTQFERQISGVESLIASKQEQVAVYRKEQSAISKLVKQELAAKNQLLVFERSFADLRGQIAEHDSEIGRLQSSIAEVEVSKLQVERTFREKAIAELEETDAKIDELSQQLEATEQQLRRTVIRAPVDGIVHELAIFTIGGVVQPGQAIMQIVPMAEKLEIEVNVETQHIDKLSSGQLAVVRFPAFNQRTTPEVFGTVERLSPTSVVDEKTGFAFYRVGISIADDQLKRLGDKALVPGMPVEAVIPTQERSVLDYLVKPLADNLAHAFREE